MNLQWAGMVLAITTFATIGAGHMLVRRLYPLLGTRLGIPFMVLGILIMIISVFVETDLISAAIGIVSITTFWDGLEFFRQEIRVQRGAVKT